MLIPVSLEKALELVKEYVKTVYRESSIPSHDINHTMRVLSLSRWIGEALGLDDRSMKKLMIAALLHDIAIVKRRNKRDHARFSAEIAQKLLSGILEEGDLKEIIEAIEDHSWKGERRPRSIIGAILQDADRLDALGAIGVFRVIAYGVAVGKEFYDPKDPFFENRELDDSRYILDHFYSKLLDIVHHMNLKIAREEAEKRTEFMRKFLRELKRELLLCRSSIDLDC